MTQTQSKRFLSLDILRGLTVAGMITVNNPGSWGEPTFAPLRHAAWDGCTPTDLVFPFFLFCVGAAIWFAYRKTDHRLTTPVVGKIVKRGLLIFLVGQLISYYPFYNVYDIAPEQIGTGRLCSILQLLGIALTVGALVWFSRRKKSESPDPDAGRERVWAWSALAGGLVLMLLPFPMLLHTPLKSLAHVRILGVFPRIAIAFTLGALLAMWLKSYKRCTMGLSVILAGYWIVSAAFGDFTLEGNVGRAIDLAVLGDAHMYHGEGIAFDPEGLFSTIPAIGTVLVGYMAGKLMGEGTGDVKRNILIMAAVGGVMVTLGLILNPYFPINKKLWSSSYVLYVGGLAMQVWALFAYLIDYRKRTGWTTFFNVFGTNALFTYCLSGLIVKTWGMAWYRIPVDGGESRVSIFSAWFRTLKEVMPVELASLLCALSLVLLCWAIAYPLYKRKIYIKL